MAVNLPARTDSFAYALDELPDDKGCNAAGFDPEEGGHFTQRVMAIITSTTRMP